MAGEKILIIDPSQEDVRPLVEELLCPEGYIVAHALDGEEGLRQALDGHPDLIIAEFATPRRPGLDILARLRQAKREVPFVLTGVYGSAGTLNRALRMGVID
jgi:CheY-like chemotaxis protein